MTPEELREYMNRIVNDGTVTIARLESLLGVSRSTVTSMMGRNGKSSRLPSVHKAFAIGEKLQKAYEHVYRDEGDSIFITQLLRRKEHISLQISLYQDELARLNSLLELYKKERIT